MTETPRATIAAPSSAPATVPTLKPGVKARQDRASEAPLDHVALDIHRHVPGAVAEAEQEEAGDDRRDADR